MGTKAGIFIIVGLMLFLSLPKAAFADPSGNTAVTVTIGDVFNIWFDPDDQDEHLLWNHIDKTDYDEGYTTSTDEDSTINVRWEANFNWSLRIQGTSQYFMHDGEVSAKPCTDIEFMNGSGYTFHHLPYALDSPSYYVLRTGTPGSFNGPHPSNYSITLPFRVKITWGVDTPGVWEYGDMLFTLAKT